MSAKIAEFSAGLLVVTEITRDSFLTCNPYNTARASAPSIVFPKSASYTTPSGGFPCPPNCGIPRVYFGDRGLRKGERGFCGFLRRPISRDGASYAARRLA